MEISEQGRTYRMSQSLSGRDPCTGKALVVRFDEGRITAVDAGLPSETAWLAPGLIDLQVNGYQGDDFNAGDLTIETVQRMACRLLATGVTTFQPTLITASEEKIVHNLRIIAAARKTNPLLAPNDPQRTCGRIRILPPEDGPRGAHPLAYVRPPDLAEFARWQAASGNLAGMVTVSPHYRKAREYIHALSQQGISRLARPLGRHGGSNSRGSLCGSAAFYASW
jgi:N-acetylglucosamine-6-phosphate deacetylase